MDKFVEVTNEEMENVAGGDVFLIAAGICGFLVGIVMGYDAYKKGLIGLPTV